MRRPGTPDHGDLVLKEHMGIFSFSYLRGRGPLRWSAPPGAVATALPESSSEEAIRKNLREFYKNGYSGQLNCKRAL